MGSWTQTYPTPGHRVWQRALGCTEAVFHWDSVFNGTADTVMHAHLRIAQPAEVNTYSCANVCRAWSSIKLRFPLLAAEVQEDQALRFVVREENVTSLRNEDVTFSTVTSLHGAERFITDILDGPRPLSPKLLARVYVLRRTDQPLHIHVILTIAHCITDGPSTSTILRTLFQTLSSPYDPSPFVIGTRLEMCYPLESRVQWDESPLWRRRWKKAIGYALHAIRLSRFKGGHTLPGNFTTATRLTSAKSRFQYIDFSPRLSAMILSNCRRYGISITCAYYALSQVALSRVLCRRYIRGEIPEEEWEYRKREPMFFNAPINLRPYQDPAWFQNGGSGEVGINVSFAQYILPFMPLGVMARMGAADCELVDGAPCFPDLMSFDRFMHRCDIVKRQAENLFKHPRFLDICVTGYNFRVQSRQAAAEAWRAMEERSVDNGQDQGCSVPVPSLGPIITQVGSSLGSMDHMVPLDYPLPAEHRLSPLSPEHHPHRAGYPVQPIPDGVVRECKTIQLHVENWRTHLRTRPAELYLGSYIALGQLQFFTFYDENVFGADVVKEWLGEIRDAVLFYLGDKLGDARSASIPVSKL